MYITADVTISAPRGKAVKRDTKKLLRMDYRQQREAGIDIDEVEVVVQDYKDEVAYEVDELQLIEDFERAVRCGCTYLVNQDHGQLRHGVSNDTGRTLS